jgi:hypothetical protein
LRLFQVKKNKAAQKFVYISFDKKPLQEAFYVKLVSVLYVRGFAMKSFANKQKCELVKKRTAPVETEMKCITFMVFEEAGKTILQPLVTNKETKRVQELLQNKTLEVWLSNGQSDIEQFDVSILKYKQQMQPSKMCSKKKNCICLKNHFETIVSCEQCPLSVEGAED